MDSWVDMRVRKGVQQIVDAFKLAFPDTSDQDVELHLYLTGL